MTWKVEQIPKSLPKLKSPILVAGLPGIGNVGKIANDFLVDDLKANILYRFFSNTLPHTVFVNEENLVELPKIELYHAKNKDKDLLFLVGDVQPVDEESSYDFTETLLDIFQKLKGKNIITLGGIGLPSEPKDINVYITGNDKKFIKDFKKGTQAKDKLYGVVGPIVGVSGLLLGLSKKTPALALLAETLGHPMYLGVKGAKEVLKILKKKLSLDINLSEIDKEIKEIESGLKQAADLSKLQKSKSDEANYIG